MGSFKQDSIRDQNKILNISTIMGSDGSMKGRKLDTPSYNKSPTSNANNAQSMAITERLMLDHLNYFID